MTRASETRPTVRQLESVLGDTYVVELRRTTITVRPKGSRKGGRSEVSITPGALYLRLMQARVDAEKASKRRARRGR